MYCVYHIFNKTRGIYVRREVKGNKTLNGNYDWEAQLQE
jgi:hypothetical protein